jgi:hypothetical protein
VERVFITYDLKDGATRDDYVAYSCGKDQVVLPAQPGIHGFDGHLVVESLHDDKPVTPPFQVIEMMTVASWQSWMDALERPDVKAIAPDFERIAETSSVRMIRARRV